MREFVCEDPKCKYRQKTAVTSNVTFTHRHGKSTKIYTLKEVTS